MPGWAPRSRCWVKRHCHFDGQCCRDDAIGGHPCATDYPSMAGTRRGQTTWLARALADPDIGRALALIHRRPEEAWTVASLAKEVHLSRSVFAERFSRLVGMSRGSRY